MLMQPDSQDTSAELLAVGILFNRSIDEPGKEMKDRSRAHVVAHIGVPVFELPFLLSVCLWR